MLSVYLDILYLGARWLSRCFFYFAGQVRKTTRSNSICWIVYHNIGMNKVCPTDSVDAGDLWEFDIEGTQLSRTLNSPSRWGTDEAQGTDERHLKSALILANDLNNTAYEMLWDAMWLINTLWFSTTMCHQLDGKSFLRQALTRSAPLVGSCH